MKKIISLLILTFVVISMFSCVQHNNDGSENDNSYVVKVGYLTGPTGIGMAKLIHDNSTDDSKYNFELFVGAEAQNNAFMKLVNKEIDIICVPTNFAATKYNKQTDEFKVLAINCLNSLFVICNNNESSIDSFDDLEGKNVYTCLQGTPRLILQHLVNEFNLNVTIKTEIGGKTITTPDELKAVLVDETFNKDIDIAVCPEPIATVVSSQTKNYYNVKVDLSDAWDTISDTPIAMGCIIASDDFIANHKAALDTFLEEYKSSIEFMSSPENNETASNYIAETKILANSAMASKALLNLGDSISYIDGEDMKAVLINVFNVFGNNAIGGKVPDDEFYYRK